MRGDGYDCRGREWSRQGKGGLAAHEPLASHSSPRWVPWTATLKLWGVGDTLTHADISCLDEAQEHDQLCAGVLTSTAELPRSV